MIQFSSSSFPFRRNEPLKRFPHRPLDFLHTLCRVLSILSHILIGALTSLLRVHIILRNLLKLPLLRLRLPLLQSLLGVHVPQPPPAHVPTGIEIGLDRYRWSGEIYDSVLAVEELDKHLVDSGDFHNANEMPGERHPLFIKYEYLNLGVKNQIGERKAPYKILGNRQPVYNIDSSCDELLLPHWVTAQEISSKFRTLSGSATFTEPSPSWTAPALGLASELASIREVPSSPEFCSSFPFRSHKSLKRFPHRSLDFLHTLCRVLSILSHILIGALPSLTPASASLLRQLFCLLVDIILRHLLKLPLLRLCLPLLQSLLGVHVPQPPPTHVSTGIEIGLDRYRWGGEIYDSVLTVKELDKHLVDSGGFHPMFFGGFGERIRSRTDGKNE
nr:hypothetical protein Iba_chr04bCG17530 [Ipomoea batatas]